MIAAVHHDLGELLITLAVVFGISGYIQYRAIQDFREEFVRTTRTSHIRGYLLGWTGIILFTLVAQTLFVLSYFYRFGENMSGALVWVSIGMICIGFLMGPKQIAKIRKKLANK